MSLFETGKMHLVLFVTRMVVMGFYSRGFGE